jgi:hypothetical protein
MHVGLRKGFSNFSSNSNMMNSWNQKNLLQQTYSSNHVHEVLIIPHDDIFKNVRECFYAKPK